MKAALALMAIGLLAGRAGAQLEPDWVARYSAGDPIDDSPVRMRVDAAGNVYMAGTTGLTGSGSFRDVVAVKFSPGGTLLWAQVYNGAADWGDQGRDLALTPEGDVVVVGNTPGANEYADLLVLKLDGATGRVIWDTTYNEEYGEAALCVAVGEDGSIFVGGYTTGDGIDFLTLKLSASGQVLWHTSLDGPAFAPFSLDAVRMIGVLPGGDPVVVGDMVQDNLHADYVTIRYRSSDGQALWTSRYGGTADDSPNAMRIDDAGDVYVTGHYFDFYSWVGTVKYRGGDGAELWSATDIAGTGAWPASLALDGVGGVYIAGSEDPDGDQSNFNDNILVVKRGAGTGDLAWTFLYGSSTKYHFDVSGDVVADPGRVFVIGNSSSPPYTGDIILFQLDPATGAEAARGVIAGGPNETTIGDFLGLDGAGALAAGGTFANYDTGNFDFLAARYGTPCQADCDGSGSLDVDDFICFQTLFGLGDPGADCDQSGELDIDDFICFQTAFGLGC